MKEDFEHYLVMKRLKSTRNLHESVKQFQEWLKGENLEETQVRYTDVLSYVKKLKEKCWKPSSIAASMNGIRHYYDFLEVSSNPVDKVSLKGTKQQKVIDLLSPVELETIYKDYPPEMEMLDVITQRNLVILGLLLFQGVTVAELRKLTTRDVKIRLGTVYIPGSRTSNGRELELKPVQALDLQTYLTSGRAQTVSCFGLDTDKLLVASSEVQGVKAVDNMVTKLLKELKSRFPKVKSAYQIRASVIVRWIKVTNLREAQNRAGHRYISSTEKYLKNDLEGLQDAVNKHHNMG